MKYVVDIDGVLTNETKGWQYLDRTPNKRNIELVNGLPDVTYFTSRFLQDAEETRYWMRQNKVKNWLHSAFDKPQYDVLIDDKSIPAPMENLDEYMNYDLKASCWRLKKGSNPEGEEHDCFFCGHGIAIEKDWEKDMCPDCDLIPCTSCKKCLCNVPVLSRITVARIHKKYCCNLPDFIGKIELDGFVDMNVIRNAEKTLSNCACIEGILE
jgi:hypothetical protein